jgi:catechol 2,3-dioxygenase-like lactoylglutathione lyase family enzyme
VGRALSTSPPSHSLNVADGMFWNSATSLFRNGGANYMPVSDLEAATAWYREKFAVKRLNVKDDNGEHCVALGLSDEEWLFELGPQGQSSGELTARLFTSNLKKAREYLVSRDVSVGEVQEDGQGTHFFTARDLDGNVIEVSEEP